MRPAVILLLLLLAGCQYHLASDRLITASCPPLTPLEDSTFGATTLKLIEVAGQYHECRCAALPKSCQKVKP